MIDFKNFKIKRGPSDVLKNPLLIIEEGCWYLSTDTAELYVGIIENDTPVLKRINGDITPEINFEGYATEDFVREAIASINIPEAEVYDDTELRNLINSKADADHLHEEYLTEHQDISHLATKEELPNLDGYAKIEDIPNVDGFIKEIPAEYVTEEELTSKGYLTEHQSLAGYATKTYVLTEIAKAALEGNDIDLSGYATKDDLNLKADITYVNEKVAGIEIPEPDLSNYYNKSEVYNKEEVNALLPHEEIREVKTTVQTIIPTVEKVEEILPKVEEEILPAVETVAELRTWVENKDYLQDIDLNGYATEIYVNNALANYQSEAELYKVDFNNPNYAEAKAAYEAGKVLVLINAAPDVNSYALMNYVTDNYITFTKFLMSRSETYGAFNTYYLKNDNTWEVAKEVKLNKVEITADGNLQIGKQLYETPSVDGLATEEYVNKKILEAEIADKEADLEAYYTKSEVDAKISSIENLATKEEVRILENNIGYVKVDDRSFAEVIDETFAKKSEIPSLEEYAKLEDVPSVEGLATEDFVKEEINKIEHPANPTKVSELENDANYTNETKVLELIAANTVVADNKIGVDFTTDITVGRLTVGTEIKADMTIGEILRRILMCDHNWIDADCTTPKTCSICGKTEGEALGHDYGDWVITKQPEVGVPGEQQKTCKRCGDVITEEIPALPQPEEPTAKLYYLGGIGNNEQQDFPSTWAELEDAGYSAFNPAIRSSYYLTEMKNNDSREYTDETIVGQHALQWKVTAPLGYDKDLSEMMEYDVIISDTDSMFAAIALPSNYEVTAWSTDADNVYSVIADMNKVETSEDCSIYYLESESGAVKYGNNTPTYYITIAKK